MATTENLISCRRLSVPLVCKEWYRAAMNSELWRHMEVDLPNQLGGAKLSLLQIPAKRYFEKRRDRLQRLTLSISPSDPNLGSQILAGLAGSNALTGLTLTYSTCTLDGTLDVDEDALSLALKRAERDCAPLLHRLGALSHLTQLSLNRHLVRPVPPYNTPLLLSAYAFTNICDVVTLLVEDLLAVALLLCRDCPCALRVQ